MGFTITDITFEHPERTVAVVFLVLVDGRLQRVGGYSQMDHPYNSRVQIVAGDVASPKGLIVLSLDPDNRTSYSTIMTLDGRTRAAEPHLEGSWVGIAHWGNAWMGYATNGWFSGMSFVKGVDPGITQQPVPAALKSHPPGRSDCGMDRPAVATSSFDALATGELVAAGSTCDLKSAVEIWRPGSKISEIIEVDGAPLASNHGLYLLGERMKRWDGKAFVDAAPLPPAPTRSVFQAPSGELFAVRVGAKPDDVPVLYRLDSGTWQAVTVPTPTAMNYESEFVFDGKNLWLTSDGIYQYAFPGAPAPVALQLAEPEKGKLVPAEKFVAGGARCESSRRALRVHEDDAGRLCVPPHARGAEGTHRARRGAFRGDEEGGGKKYLTAMTKDLATAKTVVDVIANGVKGSSPQAVCDTPEVVRDFPIDLATGEPPK